MAATTAPPVLTEDQLAALADQLMARLMPKLAEAIADNQAVTLEGAYELTSDGLGQVDVEGLLATVYSPTVGAVIPALFEARKEFKKLTKNKSNTHFGSTYADLGQVFAVSDDGLDKHGLMLLPTTMYLKLGDRMEMFLQTRLWHIKSLEWIQAWWWVKPVKDDPQGIMSSITYGRRGTATPVLGLAAEDDDGNDAARRPEGNGRRQQDEPPPPPAEEMPAEELVAIQTDIEGLSTLEEVRAMWNALGEERKLTAGVKALLNARAAAIRIGAKQDTTAEGEQPDPNRDGQA